MVKGVHISIFIPKDEYQVDIDSCKHNLHGRVIYPKGSPRLKVHVLRHKLISTGKDLKKWGVTSLGKDFYKFSFSSLKDLQKFADLVHGF